MTSCMNVSLDNFLSFDDAKVRLFSLPHNNILHKSAKLCAQTFAHTLYPNY